MKAISLLEPNKFLHYILVSLVMRGALFVASTATTTATTIDGVWLAIVACYVLFAAAVYMQCYYIRSLWVRQYLVGAVILVIGLLYGLNNVIAFTNNVIQFAGR